MLVLVASTPVQVLVGRLGWQELSEGAYGYIGSAHGSGGLRARIAHHLSPARCLHWHIDYLIASIPVVSVVFAVSRARLECSWVWRLVASGAEAPIPGFGCGDCHQRCPAHLVRLPTGFDPTDWKEYDGSICWWTQEL